MRSIVAYGFHHFQDIRAGHLHVATVEQQRCVRRPFNDTVDAIELERGQLVL